jgi:hypothetical protein
MVVGAIMKNGLTQGRKSAKSFLETKKQSFLCDLGGLSAAGVRQILTKCR